MKPIVLLLVIIYCSYTLAQSGENPFKNDKNVAHSLYRERNEWDRLSADTQGVPPSSANDTEKLFPSPDAYVAYKVTKYYKKIFDFLDTDVDDQVNQENICEAYRLYGWPMPADEQVASYVKEQFKKWDQNQDGTLDFVEFCHYMENIWTYSQYATEKICVSALRRSIAVFEKLFDYLDSDHDDKIDRSNLKYGLSYVMNKDLNADDLEKTFALYDKDNDKFLSKSEFILASMNGILVRSVEDPSITASFFD